MIPRFPLLLALCVGSAQAFLPYSDRTQSRPRLPAWDARVTSLWDGWKSRYLKADGLVVGTSAVGDSASSSRAQADGLLLSLWMGDQPTFDKIWRATEDSLWDAGRGFFRRSRLDSNFRGDAEMGIAAALVFASALADSGYWTSTSLGGKAYRARAKELIVNDLQGKVLDPATKLVSSWGGAGNLDWNPSYQSPHWIPIIEAFAIENGVVGTDWKSVRRAGHALLLAQPDSRSGMVRNFSGISGQTPGGGWGLPTAQDMGLDAIRVPFQLALAMQWHHDSLAAAWNDTVWANGRINPVRPGLYRVSSGILWNWCGAPECGATAAYQSFLPRSQWGALAVAGSARSPYARAASQRIVADFETAMTPRTGVLVSEWGDILPLGDPALDGYAQTLGLFGALVMSGRAWNVWGDLRNPPSPRDSFLLERLTASPETLALATTGSTPSTTFSARFANPKRWTLRLVGRSSGAKYSTTDSGTVVNLAWSSKQSTGALGPKFGAETVDAVLAFDGADTTGDPRNRATVLLRATTSTGRAWVRPVVHARMRDAGLIVQFSGDFSRSAIRLRLLDPQGRRLSRDVVTTASQGAISMPLEGAASGVLLLEGCRETGSDCWRMVVPAP
jgi:endo-1,4-beta-D-glucanase Y